MPKYRTIAVPAAATVLLLLSAGFFLLATLPMIEKALLPFSPDGQLQAKTLGQVQALLHRTAPFLLFTAAVTALYAAAGAWLARHGTAGAGRPGPDPRPEAVSAREKYLFLLLLAAAAAFRGPAMLRSLSFDELMTRVRFADPAFPPDIAAHGFLNHAGMTVLSWTSLKLFGDTEWALRLPALVLGLLAVAALWHWLRTEVGRPTAWAAAALLALSPVHIIFSTTARGYSAGIFFAVFSTLLYLRGLYRPSRGTRNLYVAASLAALGFNFFFIFVLVAQTAGLLTPLARKTAPPPGARMVWKALGLIALALAFGLFPVALMNSNEFLRYAERPATITYPLEVLADLWGTPAAGTLAATLLLLWGLAGLWNSRRPETAVLIGALFVCMLWSWSAPFGYMLTRYWAVLLPFLLTGAAAGAAALADRPPGRSCRLAWVAFGGAGLLLAQGWLQGGSRIVHDYSIRYRDLSAVAWKQSPPGTAFFAVGGGADLFQYYQKTPVSIIRDKEEYARFLQDHPRAACFVDLGYDQATPVREMMRDLEARARKYQVDDLAVYVF